MASRRLRTATQDTVTQDNVTQDNELKDEEDVEKRLAKKAQNITWGLLGSIAVVLLLMLLFALMGFCTGPGGVPGEKGDQGVVGPAGPQGESGVIIGPAGPQGAAGLIGEKGGPGEIGEQGPVGEQGPIGVEGPGGPQGLSIEGGPGPQGPPGQDGVPGEKGEQGLKGDQGPALFIQPAPAAEAEPNINHLLFFESDGIPITDGGSEEVPNRLSRRTLNLTTKQIIRAQWAHSVSGTWPMLSIEFFRTSQSQWVTLIPMFGTEEEAYSNQTSVWVSLPRFEVLGNLRVRAIVHGGPDAVTTTITYIELNAR